MTARKTLSPLFTWRSAICDSDLAPTLRHVALTLSLHMNERGGSCFPTHDQLKDETGLGRSTVIKALGQLEKDGWLLRTPGGGRRRGGNGRATEYAATVPQVDGSDGDTVPLVDEYRPAAGKKGPPAGHQDDIQVVNEDDKNVGDGQEIPAVALIDGRNLPLDALLEECGIDPGSPRVGQAVAALNGRKKEPGIRHLFWEEAQRWATEHDELDRLASLRADPEQFARALEAAIRRKAGKYRETLHGATMSPPALRNWWLDLELARGQDGGLSSDDMRRRAHH